jgi:diguanylate cyclase (GGDEF)-like protein
MGGDVAIIVLTLVAVAWWALFVRMFRRRERLVPSAVAWLAIVYAAWSTLVVVQAVLQDPGPREVVLRAILFLGLTAPSAWWVLALRLAAPRGLRRAHLLAFATPTILGALGTALWPTGGPFLASIAPIVHGDRMELAWTLGPAMRWFAVPYAYLLLAGALVTLLGLGWRSPRLSLRSALALSASLAFPVTGTVLAVTGLDPLPGFGLTGFLLGPSALALFFVIVGEEAFDPRSVAYGTVFRSIVEPALVVGPGGAIRDANPAARALLGEHATRSGALLADASAGLERARRSMDASSARRRLDGPLTGFDVAVTHLRDGRGVRQASVLLLRDLRDSLAREQALRDAARRDPLTGIPNRLGFETKLRTALEADADSVGVAFVDLDDFKPVNDRFGHAAGDAALVEIARRLDAALRGGDLAARLGGDEFGLLVHHATPADLEAVADRVEAALAEPIAVAGQRLRIGASIGLASAPADGTTLDALLSAADGRMYDAKRARRRQEA